MKSVPTERLMIETGELMKAFDKMWSLDGERKEMTVELFLIFQVNSSRIITLQNEITFLFSTALKRIHSYETFGAKLTCFVASSLN